MTEELKGFVLFIFALLENLGIQESEELRYIVCTQHGNILRESCKKERSSGEIVTPDWALVRSGDITGKAQATVCSFRFLHLLNQHRLTYKSLLDIFD